uniref:SCPL2 protein n=1 Tax=Fopius arisanus TaxID=64838 RepID=A0A0C9R8E3_9HYME
MKLGDSSWIIIIIYLRWKNVLFVWKVDALGEETTGVPGSYQSYYESSSTCCQPPVEHFHSIHGLPLQDWSIEIVETMRSIITSGQKEDWAHLEVFTRMKRCGCR